MAKRTCECGECKKCKHREYMNAWYRRPGSAERVRGWAHRYRDENIEKVREYDHKRPRREEPAEKRFARNAARALGKGQHPCERCGAEDLFGADGRTLIQAHHPNYENPLEVRWLCTTCHGIEHRIVT